MGGTGFMDFMAQWTFVNETGQMPSERSQIFVRFRMVGGFNSMERRCKVMVTF